MTTTKNEEKRGLKASVKNSFSNFWGTVKKVRVPTLGEWWHSLWRIIIIVMCFAVLLALLDYGLIQGVFNLQGLLPEMKVSKTLSTWYLVVLALTGLISAIGVLFQQGSSDGLTSLLGSSTQYNSSIAGAVKRVSLFTLIVGATFAALCLFSPMFLGGLV